LIALYIFALEVEVGWWPRPAENHPPVFENASLSERSVTIFLEELVGIEILSCRFPSAHQE
jgi:hypothetical protein